MTVRLYLKKRRPRMKKKHSPEFKAKLVLETLKEEKMIAQIATENSINPNMLSKWRSEAVAGLPAIFRKETAEEKLKAAYERKIEELYMQIGRLTTDLDWLKKKSQIN
jgi:transposase-like protein